MLLIFGHSPIEYSAHLKSMKWVTVAIFGDHWSCWLWRRYVANIRVFWFLWGDWPVSDSVFHTHHRHDEDKDCHNLHSRFMFNLFPWPFNDWEFEILGIPWCGPIVKYYCTCPRLIFMQVIGWCMTQSRSVSGYRRTKSQLDAHRWSINTCPTDPPSCQCHRPWPTANLLTSHLQEEGHLVLQNLNLQKRMHQQIQAIVRTAHLPLR